MPEAPISPAKLAVSVTQVLGWFSAHSCTVHSRVHKSPGGRGAAARKQQNHLKIEIF